MLMIIKVSTKTKSYFILFQFFMRNNSVILTNRLKQLIHPLKISFCVSHFLSPSNSPSAIGFAGR